MRFGIVFAATCFYLGVTVQAGVIPDRDGSHFLARAESIQMDRQREDFTAEGHALEQVAVVKRQTNPTFIGIVCGLNAFTSTCQRLQDLDGPNPQPGTSGDDNDDDNDAKGDGGSKDTDKD